MPKVGTGLPKSANARQQLYREWAGDELAKHASSWEVDVKRERGGYEWSVAVGDTPGAIEKPFRGMVHSRDIESNATEDEIRAAVQSIVEDLLEDGAKPPHR